MATLYWQLGLLAIIVGAAAYFVCSALFRIHKLLPLLIFLGVLILKGFRWGDIFSFTFLPLELPIIAVLTALGTSFFYRPDYKPDELDYFLAFINLFALTYFCWLLPLWVPDRYFPSAYMNRGVDSQDQHYTQQFFLAIALASVPNFTSLAVWIWRKMKRPASAPGDVPVA